VSIPTQEDAHLMVRLYKLRLNPYLQQAEDWFNTQFQPGTWEEVKAKYPMGSEEWRKLTTVLGYWEMLGALVDHNLLSEDLLFDAIESMDYTWQRVKEWLPSIRPEVGPEVWENIELLAGRQQKWHYTRIPKALRP
jgi:hypothetical protein